jgi:hypothetical protein
MEYKIADKNMGSDRRDFKLLIIIAVNDSFKLLTSGVQNLVASTLIKSTSRDFYLKFIDFYLFLIDLLFIYLLIIIIDLFTF